MDPGTSTVTGATCTAPALQAWPGLVATPLWSVVGHTEADLVAVQCHRSPIGDPGAAPSRLGVPRPARWRTTLDRRWPTTPTVQLLRRFPTSQMFLTQLVLQTSLAGFGQWLPSAGPGSGIPQPPGQLDGRAQFLHGSLRLSLSPVVDSSLDGSFQLIWEALLGRHQQLAAGLDRLGSPGWPPGAPTMRGHRHSQYHEYDTTVAAQSSRASLASATTSSGRSLPPSHPGLGGLGRRHVLGVGGRVGRLDGLGASERTASTSWRRRAVTFK